jgi:rhodanese-related sulfurtransferase
MRTRQALNIVTALCVLLVFMSGCSTTAPTAPVTQPAVAAVAPFHAIVDVAFVQQHVQAPMPEGVMLIDSRPQRPKYDEGHIPMAVSIPDSKFEQMQNMLPADKKTLLIFYCGGPACDLSHKSARKAEALGYTNVKVFSDGFPGWMKVPGNFAAVSTDWVKQQVDAKADMVLVDSRPKQGKYDQGHLPGAISISDTQFDKLTSQLPADKNKMLVFYCGGLACPLSNKSASKAIALGYTNVKVYPEGYPGWVAASGTANVAAGAAGTGTASAAKAPSGSLKAGKAEGTIDPALFKKILAENPTQIMLIDVRDKNEYDKGTLKTAINIPVDDLEKKIASLSTDKPIVFVCGTGARSGESYYMVKDKRPELKEVYYLDGELTIQKDGTFVLKEPA